MTDAPATDQPVEAMDRATSRRIDGGRGGHRRAGQRPWAPGGPGTTRAARRSTARCATIKDEVLRMGSLVAAQIGSALDALVAHDADKAMAMIVGDGRINEAQRHISSLITTTIATQRRWRATFACCCRSIT